MDGFGDVDNRRHFLRAHLFKKQDNRYEVVEDTLLLGYDLKRGDVLRNEQSELPEIRATATEIGKRVRGSALTVSLYHLDSLTLSKFKKDELETIYNSLR